MAIIQLCTTRTQNNWAPLSPPDLVLGPAAAGITLKKRPTVEASKSERGKRKVKTAKTFGFVNSLIKWAWLTLDDSL